MAFKKLDGCDKSDMSLWGLAVTTRNFKMELDSMREQALRNLIKTPSDGAAERVRVLDSVLGLIEEAANM